MVQDNIQLCGSPINNYLLMPVAVNVVMAFLNSIALLLSALDVRYSIINF